MGGTAGKVLGILGGVASLGATIATAGGASPLIPAIMGTTGGALTAGTGLANAKSPLGALGAVALSAPGFITGGLGIKGALDAAKAASTGTSVINGVSAMGAVDSPVKAATAAKTASDAMDMQQKVGLGIQAVNGATGLANSFMPEPTQTGQADTSMQEQALQAANEQIQVGVPQYTQLPYWLNRV